MSSSEWRLKATFAQVLSSTTITETDTTTHWGQIMWGGLGAGSCWRQTGTMSSWGTPWAFEMLVWGASWVAAWYPAACWEVSERTATGTWRQGGCGPCGGAGTSPRELRGRAWCGGWSREEGGSRGGGEEGTGPSLEDCAGLERLESRVLPFLLESLHLRWVGEILQAEAGRGLPELSCDLVQPSSASCTLISCSGTRSSPETQTAISPDIWSD